MTIRGQYPDGCSHRARQGLSSQKKRLAGKALSVAEDGARVKEEKPAMSSSDEKAYVVYEPDDVNGGVYAAEVVFAGNPGQAKVRSTLDTEFVFLRAKRAPEYDRYAPGPVPVEVLIRDGWVFRCEGCERRVREDAVMRGRAILCPECSGGEVDELAFL